MSNSSSGRCRTDSFPLELPIFRFGSTTQPISKVANTQGAGVKLGARRSPVVVHEVVLTLTLKLVTALALMFSLVGTMQTASLGAPEQVRAAVPLIPFPPRERV